MRISDWSSDVCSSDLHSRSGAGTERSRRDARCQQRVDQRGRQPGNRPMTPLRRLGATDLETPPLMPGGNVFGWTADKQTSFAILDRFVDRGGCMIDTADVYSARSEEHTSELSH